MKYCKLLGLLLLTCLPAMLRAQAFTVRADKMNLVYIGMDNQLTIVSGKCSCKDLSVTADRGELKKLEGCNYVYRATQEGKMELSISQTTGGKTKRVGFQQFRVKRIGDPYVMVGRQKSGYCSLASFKVQKGVSVTIDNFESTVLKLEVTKFSVRVLRKGGSVFHAEITGALFNKECIDFFSSLKANDVVEISHISITGPDSGERSVPDLTFTMI